MSFVALAALTVALVLALPAAAAQAPVLGKISIVKNTAAKLVVEVPVDSAGSETTAHLEFGRTAALGGTTGDIHLAASGGAVPVTFTVGGATGQTTYFIRVVARNAAGESATEIMQITTPPARAKALKGPTVSFAISTGVGGRYPWRVLAASRPTNQPVGTRLTIRCHSGCTGSRTVLLGSGRAQIRFSPGIRITRRSVLEIRATHQGYVGRIRRFEFRGSGSLITARRVLNRCLAGSPAQIIACPR